MIEIWEKDLLPRMRVSLEHELHKRAMAWEMWRTRSPALRTDGCKIAPVSRYPATNMKTQRGRPIEGISARPGKLSKIDQMVKHLTTVASADHYLHDPIFALVSTNNSISQLIIFISSDCHLCARLS